MTQKDNMQMLKDLTDAKGIPGNEKEPREVMEKYIAPYADEVTTDHLGSLIAKKTGDENGPKIMVAGHLDEIGFMITRIDDNGFLYFQTVGGWWSQVMLAQRVTIMTKKGDVTGVVGSQPPHILSAEQRKKPVDIKDMFIDIGAASKEEAEEFGVRPGDSVVPYFEFTQMNNEKLLLAKAWDNRIGCAIAIEVLKRLKDEQHQTSSMVLERFKKKSVYAVRKQVHMRSSRTSVLVWTSVSLETCQEFLIKMRLRKWVKAHKLFYMMHPWFLIKACVTSLLKQQKKTTFHSNMIPWQVAVRTQVQSI